MTQKEYQAAYHQANKDKIRVQHAAYYHANRKQILSAQNVYNEKNKEKIRVRSVLYYQRTKSRQNQQMKEWYKKNSEKVKKAAAQWKVKNYEKALMLRRNLYARNSEKIGKQNDNWRKKHPDKHAAVQAHRRARLLKATPKWADLAAMAIIYKAAKEKTRLEGIKYNVDHIVPLQSKLVCGLHCEDNLQIIPEKENKRKLNRFWSGMPAPPTART